MLKNQKGITLIALIITIIVLLILAGISISMVVGDNGILSQAQKAKKETEYSSAEEKLSMEIVGSYNSKLELPIEDVKVNVSKIGTVNNPDATEFPLDVTVDGYDFWVDVEGNVSQIVTDLYPGRIDIDEEGNTLDGSEEGPFEIWCIEDLCYFSDLTNGTDSYGFGNTSTDKQNFRGKYVLLMCDLDFNSDRSYSLAESLEEGGLKDILATDGFIPISNAGGNMGYSFGGNFEGQNHTIANIYINETESYAGLFGETRGAYIYDLTITGEITGTCELAGISGSARDGIISNCKNYANITSSDSMGYVGGIVGYVSYSQTIQYCANYGDLQGTHRIGGIAGNNTYGGTITKCYNAGTITASQSAGGIIGTGKAELCYNTGTIVGTDTTGENSTGLAVGGIAGTVYGEVKNCYNTGEVTGTNFLTAGIVGDIQPNGTLLNCYNVGQITSSRVNVGVVGHTYGAVTDSYTIEPYSIYRYLATYNSVTGSVGEECAALSETNMKDSTFLDKMNDGLETSVWVADTIGINKGYPILSWQLENK